MASCLIGIGSNLGDRAALIERAWQLLAELPQTTLVARSGPHETTPVGGPAAQQPYLNAAALLTTELPPFALLDHLQRIEQELDRVRTQRWGSRTIDLDLLLYDALEITSDRLTLPHPRFAWRRFALAPAAEVAPDLVHPTIGWTVSKLLANLDCAETFVAIVGPPGGGVSSLAEEVARRVPARYLRAEPDDPASPSLESHLRLLARKRRLSERDTWPADDRCSIGEFSLVESWAAALVSLAADDLARFVAPWEEAIAATIAPKLTVLVDEPFPSSSQFDPRWVEHYREELLELLERPGAGPLLVVPPMSCDEQVAEIVAAIQSMQ